MLHGAAASPHKTDSPHAREYNRIRRWLTITDAALGFCMLLILLLSGWSEQMRDFSLKIAEHHYTLGLLYYIIFFTLLRKLIELPLDYYGFRVEHRFELSNQKLRSWIRDEFKSYVVELLIAGVLLELLYFTVRAAPRTWWIIAWLGFIALFVLQIRTAR
jgi:STE24 endopeptidase